MRCSVTGTSFEKKEMFGQLPLQVDGFKDIHESLEAATAQGEIEALNEEHQSRSCQEVLIYSPCCYMDILFNSRC